MASSYASISLLDLPDETLLNILQYLDHCDLQSCHASSKRLCRLTQDRTLDAASFRPHSGIAPRTISRGSGMVQVHPIFAKTNLYQDDVDDFRVYDNLNRPTNIRVKDTYTWNQMATNPPLASLRFKLGSAKASAVTNRTGIRVRDLLRAVARVMKKAHHRSYTYAEIWLSNVGGVIERYSHAEVLAFGNLSSAEKDRRARNIEVMGRRPVGKGFIRQHTTVAGTLVLGSLVENRG